MDKIDRRDGGSDGRVLEPLIAQVCDEQRYVIGGNRKSCWQLVLEKKQQEGLPMVLVSICGAILQG